MTDTSSNLIDLAAYRARKAPPAAEPPAVLPPAPAFKASNWPDNDFNELGRRLVRIAEAVRTGTVPSQDALAFVLDSYSASAFAASETIRTFETFIRNHEREKTAKRARRAKR
jgi:hypothetical protein